MGPSSLSCFVHPEEQNLLSLTYDPPAAWRDRRCRRCRRRYIIVHVFTTLLLLATFSTVLYILLHFAWRLETL